MSLGHTCTLGSLPSCVGTLPTPQMPVPTKLSYQHNKNTNRLTAATFCSEIKGRRQSGRSPQAPRAFSFVASVGVANYLIAICTIHIKLG